MRYFWDLHNGFCAGLILWFGLIYTLSRWASLRLEKDSRNLDIKLSYNSLTFGSLGSGALIALYYHPMSKFNKLSVLMSPNRTVTGNGYVYYTLLCITRHCVCAFWVNFYVGYLNSITAVERSTSVELFLLNIQVSLSFLPVIEPRNAVVFIFGHSTTQEQLRSCA